MAIRGVGITNFLPEEKKNQARRCQILRLIFCTDGNPWSLTVLCGKTECVCVFALSHARRSSNTDGTTISAQADLQPSSQEGGGGGNHPTGLWVIFFFRKRKVTFTYLSLMACSKRDFVTILTLKSPAGQDKTGGKKPNPN